MAAETSPDTVANNLVVRLAYKLTVEGKVLDEAGEQDAIHFLQGHKNIIPGLERELNGMKIGESKTIVVSPEDGYGPVNEDEFDEVALEDFPEGIEPEVGMQMEMKDEDGAQLYGRVHEIGEDSVTMDFNHPLAGKELHFEVKVVGLRPASAEELSHGHVHGPHGHH